MRRLRAPSELPLFSALIAPELPGMTPLELADGNALLYRDWLAPVRADALAAEVSSAACWVQERRTMYDRVVDVPREQAWFGNNESWYRDGYDAELQASEDDRAPRYGAVRDLPIGPWTRELGRVRDEIQELVNATFAYVLANRYRNGNDSVAWHNDRLHPALPEPVIASLSLGATRAFDIREKARPRDVVSVDLAHGDLLVMLGAMQLRFDHRVRKDALVAGERLNLTFRERARLLPQRRTP